MELRRLRLLHELSRRRTVAAVARALSYSPSSVSVQLAELEREAGVKLVRRVGRNLELTAAGRRLAAYAERALAAEEEILAELATTTDAPRGRVRMTLVQTPALALLPGLLRRLADATPDVHVEVTQRETSPALDDLRSRAVDLVVGVEYEPVPVPRFSEVDRRDLLREDVLLAVHPRHPAVGERISVADTAQDVWASGHRGTGLDAVVSNVCNRLGGFDPDVRHRTDDGLILSALVASGRAVALLPALVASALPQIAARPIREGHLQRTIFTATRRAAGGAPAIAAVRDALARTVREQAADRRDIEALGAV